MAEVVSLDGESKPKAKKRPEIVSIEAVAARPTVAFVKLNPQMRIYKQAQALKETGRYRLVLVANRYDRELFEPVFDEIIDFGTDKALQQHLSRAGHTAIQDRSIITANQLADVLRRLSPSIIHAHAEPNCIPAVAIKSAAGPVIYDAYDCYGLRAPAAELDRDQLHAERYCLENADGIAWKFPASLLDFYRDEFDYDIDAPFLCFPDYCRDEFIAPAKNKSLNLEDIQLVYGGVIVSSDQDPRIHANNQLMPFIRSIVKQKMAYHLYTHPWQWQQEKMFSDYRQLQANSPLFRFHAPLRLPMAFQVQTVLELTASMRTIGTLMRPWCDVSQTQSPSTRPISSQTLPGT